MDILAIYLCIINAAALTLMLADKRRAKNNAWRIPELTLMGVAALGGSLGALLGMRLFRHKTRKPKFFIGIPVFLVIHILLILLFMRKVV